MRSQTLVPLDFKKGSRENESSQNRKGLKKCSNKKNNEAEYTNCKASVYKVQTAKNNNSYFGFEKSVSSLKMSSFLWHCALLSVISSSSAHFGRN